MLDVILRLAPVTIRVRSPFRSVAEHIERFYAPRSANSAHRRDDPFVDFDIRLAGGANWRRWLRPQARFLLDNAEPFLPLPSSQAAPLFEWGLNWCFATRPLGYLVMHAAVVAQDDDALILPGFPGAGKSTLCAALTFSQGWRLLSDELAILEPGTGELQPNPRPISVKNESLRIVSAFSGATLGPTYSDTRKGTVAHLAPPAASLAVAERTARCGWVVFPRFTPGAPASCEEITRAEAFARIAEQSFNRDRMGEAGFHAICAMLDGARCFEIAYGSTADGLGLIGEITSERARR